MSKPRFSKSRSSKKTRNTNGAARAQPTKPMGQPLHVGSGGLIVLGVHDHWGMVPAWVEILEDEGDALVVGIVARRTTSGADIGFEHVPTGFIEKRRVSVREVLPVSGGDLAAVRRGQEDHLVDLRLGRAFDQQGDRFVVVDSRTELPPVRFTFSFHV